jgi:hypothetical protein
MFEKLAEKFCGKVELAVKYSADAAVSLQPLPEYPLFTKHSLENTDKDSLDWI